jgi:excisionase family DNA binding protein
MVDCRYYTPQQAADTLGVDDEQVHRWIHSGQLVAINVAKSLAGKRPRWRIAESELGRFLLSRQNKVPAPSLKHRTKNELPFKRYV